MNGPNAITRIDSKTLEGRPKAFAIILKNAHISLKTEVGTIVSIIWIASILIH